MNQTTHVQEKLVIPRAERLHFNAFYFTVGVTSWLMVLGIAAALMAGINLQLAWLFLPIFIAGSYVGFGAFPARFGVSVETVDLVLPVRSNDANTINDAPTERSGRHTEDHS